MLPFLNKTLCILACGFALATNAEPFSSGDFCESPGGGEPPPVPHGNECQQRFRARPSNVIADAEVSVRSHDLHSADSQLLRLNVCGLPGALNAAVGATGYLSLVEVSFAEQAQPTRGYTAQLTIAPIRGKHHLLVTWYQTSNPDLSISDPAAAAAIPVGPAKVVGELSEICDHSNPVTPIDLNFLPSGSGGLVSGPGQLNLGVQPALTVGIQHQGAEPSRLAKLGAVDSRVVLERRRIWAGRLGYENTLDGHVVLTWEGIAR